MTVEGIDANRFGAQPSDDAAADRPARSRPAEGQRILRSFRH